MAAREEQQAGSDGSPDDGGFPGRPEPVDLAHLARQTLGDNALEREILEMFSTQIASVYDAIAVSSGDSRRRLAHGIVGSARGVGAFALAACAAEIENDPADDRLIERFRALAGDARSFIAMRNGRAGDQ